jgi:hypothetical protein
MRHCLGLLMLGLLAVCSLPGAARAEAVTEELRGYGATAADARQDALEKARDWVAVRLAEYEPRLSRVPSAATLIDLRVVEIEDEKPTASDLLGKTYRAAARVTLNESDVRQLLRLDVLFRRQVLAAKVGAALVLLLGALALFFRLEETTRGYYSGPLKVGLFLALSGVAAALWFML